MPITTGRFETPNASKYLQQLCKHFSHKVEVEFTEDQGTVFLPVGPAKMTADDKCLTIEIDVSDPENIARAHNIIDSHLERFAFREDFKAMNWETVE